MADTTYTDGITPITADSMNDLNRLHYTILGDPSDAAAIKGVVAPTLGTSTASTSGTAITFTGIPSWAKRITVNFVGVSTNGTDTLLIQLGDSGGIEASGYFGTGASINSAGASASVAATTGFLIPSGSAGNLINGSVTITLENSANFTWCAQGVLGDSANALTFFVGGRKSTSAALDRVSITTLNGTDAFDSGEINIQYQ